ncbi:MAG: hypothetical protein JO047_04305 [Alphaproteobacteria bacterium]|nr:hypothetical protein [Alphaproteobacteria bacterium]
MRHVIPCLALGGAVALAACAAPPPGPSVLAMPGQGKSFDQFQRDEGGCRQYADAQTGYGAATAQANQAGVGSALLSTGLGAAAGALLGAAAGNAGAGAAIGAGSGLLFGGAVGANQTAWAAGGIQRQYDMAYTQCMAATGNRVPAAPNPYPYAYAPYGPGPYDPY